MALLEAGEPLCHIITPIGMLGYGFDEDLTSSALSSFVATGVPTALILDSGSTDSGPSKLALGTMTVPRSAYVRDLTKLSRLVRRYKIPLVFSSAGGDGSDEHVDEMVDIMREIAAEHGYPMKVVAVYAGMDKQLVRQRFKDGKTTPCGVSVPELTEKDINDAVRVVAQMGPEPLIDAMETYSDFDVLIAGRAYDPAPYVAFATTQLQKRTRGKESMPPTVAGGFTHMGKIMECGGLCALPKSHGAAATLYEYGVFDVVPLDPGAKCTPASVAAHALYENVRPDVLFGLGGALHLGEVRYFQLGDRRTTRVSGAVFRSSMNEGGAHRLKLEGARVVGFRCLFMGSISDIVLLGHLDELLVRVRGYVAQQHAEISHGDWDLGFHTYGRGPSSSNCFVVGEARAATQQLARSIASTARVAMIHGAYPGQKATAGNFGFGIGGLTEIEAGPCAEFCVYHLMDLLPGEERLGSRDNEGCLPLRHKVELVGNSAEQTSTIENVPNSMNETALGKPKKAKINDHATPSSVSKPPIQPRVLGDLAQILRSKNAGPYDITIDIVFSSETIYSAVKCAADDFMSPAHLAQVLGVAEQDIIWSGFFDAALAFKVTIPRMRGGQRRAAGGFMEDDMHGTQQHGGVYNIALPQSILDLLA